MTNSMALRIRTIKELNRTYYGRAEGSNADYAAVYSEWVKNSGTFDVAHSTRLYKNKSGEYCGLVYILSAFYADHQIVAR
jgi:hypothetical protein